ncbi:Hypothetical predicted protein [Paramuricea clavata]|uniref:Uncharacterized protein n=1 Tax=Paramuricea clavata TaxID=317549 RepID=A0A7D9ITZ0_PARCT|nr:Hypothetical predicted protein [Paramuricea clavata]
MILFLRSQNKDMDKGGESPTPSEQDSDDNNEEDFVENEETQQQGERQMIATTSFLAGENPVTAHDPGSDRRPPIQETGDGQKLYQQQPAKVGLNPNIMAYDSDADPDLEEELGGIIIGQSDGNGQVEILVIKRPEFWSVRLESVTNEPIKKSNLPIR